MNTLMYTSDIFIREKYNISEDWICNIQRKHKEDEEEIRGHKIKCSCLICLTERGMIENSSDYFTGPPCQVSHSYSVQDLIDMNLIGLYSLKNKSKEE